MQKQLSPRVLKVASITLLLPLLLFGCKQSTPAPTEETTETTQGRLIGSWSGVIPEGPDMPEPAELDFKFLPDGVFVMVRRSAIGKYSDKGRYGIDNGIVRIRFGDEDFVYENPDYDAVGTIEDGVLTIRVEGEDSTVALRRVSGLDPHADPTRATEFKGFSLNMPVEEALTLMQTVHKKAFNDVKIVSKQEDDQPNTAFLIVDGNGMELVRANAENRVTQFSFPPEVTNPLFGVEEASVEEFRQTFIEQFNASLDSEPIDLPWTSWEYSANKGFHITIHDDKSLLLKTEAIEPPKVIKTIRNSGDSI